MIWVLLFFSLSAWSQEIVIIDDFSSAQSHGQKVKEVLTYSVEEKELITLSAHDYQSSLEKVLEIKPKVLNLSLGGSEFNEKELELLKAITTQGTWVIVAAGNDNEKVNGQNPIYPCVYKIHGLICVGALDGDKKSHLSNFGPSVKFYEKGNYKKENVTSFASPRVSALVYKMIKCNLNPEDLASLGSTILVQGYAQTRLDKLNINDFCYKPLAHGPI